MPTGFGAYSTPPLVTNVETVLAEGTLPPFPEHDELVGEDKKLTPMWRRWFAKQRSWLTDKGAYTPTDIAFTDMGTAAVSGNPVFQWWKQGNIVYVYFDLVLTGVSASNGSLIMKPLPFDPTRKILQNGSAIFPLFTVSAMAFFTSSSLWTAIPARLVNGKPETFGTYLQCLSVPNTTTNIRVSGTYITDN